MTGQRIRAARADDLPVLVEIERAASETFRTLGMHLVADDDPGSVDELTPYTAEGSYRPLTVDPFGTARAALKPHATVDRRDWGLSWQLPLPDGGDAVGWKVELTADLELVKAA